MTRKRPRTDAQRAAERAYEQRTARERRVISVSFSLGEASQIEARAAEKGVKPGQWLKQAALKALVSNRPPSRRKRNDGPSET